MRSTIVVDQAGVEDPDLVFGAPLQGELHFTNQGEVLNIEGELHTALVMPCSRCLTDVALPLEVHANEHLPIEYVTHPDREPGPDEDVDVVIGSFIYLEQGRPTLDLDELMRQWLIAEVPIRVLCDEDCAGICPQCGGNRNENPCLCADSQSNSPLAGLAALLPQLQEDEERADTIAGLGRPVAVDAASDVK